MATLVEQWARDFLHRANMNSDPVTRALLFSYLFYGLKRFNMHAVVEIIPLLLHWSLFFFLAGLVPFLLPVNVPLTGLAAFLLCLVTATYLYLTVLPIIHLDSPYRTPLSGAAWRIFKDFSILNYRRYPTSDTNPPSKSMIAAITSHAKAPSPERAERDRRALAWTLSSLNNDYELELFLETIPDVLWGPQGRRRIHDDQIHGLMDHAGGQLWWRMRALLLSCDTGLLSPDAETRRQITCYKAFWALAQEVSDLWIAHFDVE